MIKENPKIYENINSNLEHIKLKKEELVSVLSNLLLFIYSNSTVNQTLEIFNTLFLNITNYFSVLPTFNSTYETLSRNLNITSSYFERMMEIILNGKRTWNELKCIVNDVRRKFSTQHCTFPSNIHFRNLADGRIRIYFLCVPPNGFDSTLLYVDIVPGQVEQANCPPILEWHPVLDSASNLNTQYASRELQLLLERKRMPMSCINSYEFHKKSGKIVFPACNSLYQCLDTGFNATPLFPTELRTCQTQWSPMDPLICPQNSDLVAYISGGDIWVTHSLSGHGERLTNAHDGSKSFANDPLSAGVPSYVMQEEFSRYQGFWWQPSSEDGIYRMCYEEVDESDVGLHSIGGDYEEYRFPRAGTPNAKSKIKLVEFRLSETLRITDVATKELQYSLAFLFPWLEYIVRIGWTPDAKYVWAQIMNRQQQRLDLILIPVENFCCEPYNSTPSTPEHEDQHMWKSSVNESPKPIQVIYTETAAKTWVNVNDLLFFLELTDTFATFIWASEENGFRHLYLVTSSLTVKSPHNGVRTHSVFAEEGSDDYLTARIIKKIPLTIGEWEVLGKNLWYDKQRKLVYFLGLAHSPLEKHLYVFNLLHPSERRLLTTAGSSNTIDFNDECTIMVRTHSQTNRLPTTEILRVEQTCENGTVDGLELVNLGYLMLGEFDNSEYTPLIFNLKISSGETLYAMVFKPHNFKVGIMYPTILNVYGGPEVQVVSNSFKGMRQLRMHMLASQGYCVICVDSRGSRHRGVEFESHIRCRMGTVELADQVEVLKILSRQLGYIDMTRVGIHGWSYGGYLSLMGLAHYPDIFKVAIAGAPVTNWEYYDTGYTERYMDLPENNRQGYLAGNVLSYIHKFPEEANRLLLIHGLIDENVHFFHTSQLINHLVRANKPYQLQIYPGERHSLRNLESSKHYETYLLSFLQDNL